MFTVYVVQETFSALSNAIITSFAGPSAMFPE